MHEIALNNKQRQLPTQQKLFFNIKTILRKSVWLPSTIAKAGPEALTVSKQYVLTKYL